MKQFDVFYRIKNATEDKKQYEPKQAEQDIAWCDGRDAQGRGQHAFDDPGLAAIFGHDPA